MQSFFILYSAGTLGAVLSTALGWLGHSSGLFFHMGSSLSPQFSMSTIYPRLVFGGLWALLYLLPGVKKLSWLQAGILLALFPSLAQWLYFFPSSGSGWFGLSHGWGTPVIIFLLNLVWGFTTTLSAEKLR